MGACAGRAADANPGDVSPTGDTDGRLDAADVTKLRAENAERRTKAKDAETAREAAEAQLKAARERLLGLEVASHRGRARRSERPAGARRTSDLIDEDGNFDPPEGIREAADSLLERKPHLPPRTPTGDVGQGPRGKPAEVFDLVGLLQERAE